MGNSKTMAMLGSRTTAGATIHEVKTASITRTVNHSIAAMVEDPIMLCSTVFKISKTVGTDHNMDVKTLNSTILHP